MYTLDKYIIKKFLGTFFFSLALIISISIMWDITEKMDDFIEKHAPLRAILFDYYLNFIPYFASILSPLFVFIAVVFFTAKMATNTEIVAILSSGISFRRLMRPYFITAATLAIISFYFNGWVIPHSNKVRIEFENRYVFQPFVFHPRNIHRQLSPGVFAYFESYNNMDNTAFHFTLENIKEGKLTYKLTSDMIRWDSISKKWRVENYLIREIHSIDETLKSGVYFDTTFAFTPADFNQRSENIESMDNGELSEFISQERERGAENIEAYLVEKYRRTSMPFATFILTLIGVSIASRKLRGGIGIHIVFGISISFIYIFLMQISNTFAISGGAMPLLSVWIPNIIFAVVGIILMRYAPK